MIDLGMGLLVSVWTAFLFLILTEKPLGALQQSGYKNRVFLDWLTRKNNMLFNRLCVLSLCLALMSAVTTLCFSFLGETIALLISAVPYIGLLLAFRFADGRYALKVRTAITGRLLRLILVYYFLTACVSYTLIAFLSFLAAVNGSQIYRFVQFVPFAIMPMLTPFLLCLANGICSPFENARNKKFVKRAGQVLDETEIIRVGIVGSYGKTSVKNILKTLLLEKYAVIETPESYNTPIGIAKTVFSESFTGKQVLIAEMGARKPKDISELCEMVKPDYAVFTGVCEQHIETFGCIENVFQEKSEILRCGAKKVVCGENLRGRVEETETVSFSVKAEEILLGATKTEFVLTLGGKSIKICLPLLGKVAVENAALAASLAFEMGLTAEEIERGFEKVQPVPHRLQLLEKAGVYILDDGYNCNPVGAVAALEALGRFSGRKCVVTPGIVECGVLEEDINGELGEKIAQVAADKVILIGDTLVGAVKKGFEKAGGNLDTLVIAHDLENAKEVLATWLLPSDAVLFMNDLPDIY